MIKVLFFMSLKKMNFFKRHLELLKLLKLIKIICFRLHSFFNAILANGAAILCQRPPEVIVVYTALIISRIINISVGDIFIVR